MFRFLLCCVALPGAALLVAGCSEEYPPTLVPPVATDTAAPEVFEPVREAVYAIAPGDKLLITSYYNPALKQTVTVLPDGKVSLLLVGSVTAAGKSPEQLSKELGRDYRKFVDNSEINVSVDESAGLSVYVGGDVSKPAVQVLKSDLTLLQAITAAGGFLSTGNKEQVLILRRTPDGRYRTLQANAEKILRNEAPEIYLRRHDVVFVPKTQIAQVDQFVDQYISQIVPRWLNATFGFGYQIHSTGGGSATTINNTTTR